MEGISGIVWKYLIEKNERSEFDENILSWPFRCANSNKGKEYYY
jgi:hypothetical protein